MCTRFFYIVVLSLSFFNERNNKASSDKNNKQQLSCFPCCFCQFHFNLLAFYLQLLLPFHCRKFRFILLYYLAFFSCSSVL